MTSKELEEILRDNFYYNDHDECGKDCGKRQTADAGFKRVANEIIQLFQSQQLQLLERLESEAREIDLTDVERYEHSNGKLMKVIPLSALSTIKEEIEG